MPPTESPAPACTPLTPAQLLAVLDKLGIAYQHHKHPPMLNVAAAKRYRGSIPGTHTKNLFLRDHKQNHFLLVAQEDKAINLKALATTIASRRLSFASPDRLMRYLGVVPGAVTPFALIHDQNHRVRFLLDEELMACEIINCHPLTYSETLTIATVDLLRFLAHTGHEPTRITLK